MSNSKKDLLRKVLIAGKINVQTYEQIKADIFNTCGMDIKNTNDRMKWSNWINGKVAPSEDMQKKINLILTHFKLKPIYDQIDDD